MSDTNSPSQHKDKDENNDNKDKHVNVIPPIPVEIVSEEEMAIIEAALAAARSFSLSTIHRNNVRSIDSITLLSKRTFSTTEIEDLGVRMMTQKKNKLQHSLLHRFRHKRGLAVTDFTSTEWCEKQMEFVLLLGKRKLTKAMKAGSARHAILEEEVISKVNVRVETVEDKWALKFLNFMAGANKLLSDGLTRELPIIGLLEGVWMVGIIDEIRMPKETDIYPVLVDTKTRVRATLPAEPQRRNGRLQLMCYKSIWDNIVTDNFPSEKFFTSFSLNPYQILSEDIRKSTENSSLPSKTLDDVVRYYRNTCSMLRPASEQLILRYELQKDNSVIAECQFPHDPEWLKAQIQTCLEFWRGEREASYTPEDERWKCNCCQFNSVCPTRSSYGNDSSPKEANLDSAPSPSTDPESTLS